MKYKFLPLGLVALAAGGALAITTLSPAKVPQYTQVTPPQERIVACQPVAAGSFHAFSPDEFTIFSPPDAEMKTSDPVMGAQQEALNIVRGSAPWGGFLDAAGLWSGCQQPATEGIVGFLDASVAELRVTNPDPTAAAVDLTILGPDGEVSGLGARGISLAPGESRPIAISVIAEQVQGPVAVHWRTSSGRVIAQGVTTATVAHVTPSTVAATEQTLPGIGPGGTAKVVIANPGDTRVSGTVSFHSTTSTYVPSGGEDVSVPARSAVLVDVSAGTGGEPGSVTVTSDEPLSATLYTGASDGAAVAQAASTEFTAALPAGMTIQITNVGDETADVTVTGAEIHDLQVPGGTTATVDAGEGLVTVTSSVPVQAAAVGGTGKTLIPLGDTAVADPVPMNAEQRPVLR